MSLGIDIFLIKDVNGSNFDSSRKYPVLFTKLCVYFHFFITFWGFADHFLDHWAKAQSELASVFDKNGRAKRSGNNLH